MEACTALSVAYYNLQRPARTPEDTYKVFQASDMVNHKHSFFRSNGFFIDCRGLYVTMAHYSLNIFHR